MSQAIAKQLLIRWAENETTLDQYRPAVREFVYAVDTGNVFMGTQEGARKLSYWTDVTKYVQDQVTEYKPKSDTDDGLATNLQPGQIGFNTDIKRLQFLDPDTNVRQTYLASTDAILRDCAAIKVTSDNIDSDDNDSVTLSDFKRPYRLVAVNGTLINRVKADTPYYVYDDNAKTLKIYHMSDGDIISYF